MLSYIKQTGFTLIEFMLAMAMSLFVVLALSGIFIHIKNAFFGQNNLGRIQENQRLAITSLTNTIQMAGHVVAPHSGSTPDTVFKPDSRKLFGAGQFIALSGNELSVRYQTAHGDGLMNCLGSSNTDQALQVVTNSFSFDEKQQTLSCTATDNTSGSSASVVIASHVAQFKLSLGIDADGDYSTDYYASSLPANDSRWGAVQSVRIDMQFSNLVDPKASATATSGNQPLRVVHYINIMNRHEIR